MALAAGTKGRSSNLNWGIVARGVRTTSSATANSTTDVAVLRISGISLVGGLEYRICTNTLAPNSSVGTDVVRIQIHYNISGGNALVTDTVLPGGQVFSPGNSGGFPSSPLECEYVPSSTLTLSVLLAVARASGSGNCSLFADGTRTIELKVYSSGTSVADTGTGNSL